MGAAGSSTLIASPELPELQIRAIRVYRARCSMLGASAPRCRRSIVALVHPLGPPAAQTGAVERRAGLAVISVRRCPTFGSKRVRRGRRRSQLLLKTAWGSRGAESWQRELSLSARHCWSRGWPITRMRRRRRHYAVRGPASSARWLIRHWPVTAAPIKALSRSWAGSWAPVSSCWGSGCSACSFRPGSSEWGQAVLGVLLAACRGSVRREGRGTLLQRRWHGWHKQGG